jgi:hypothetical protein
MLYSRHILWCKWDLPSSGMLLSIAYLHFRTPDWSHLGGSRSPRTAGALQMGPNGCLEMSVPTKWVSQNVSNYQSVLWDIPEEQRFQYRKFYYIVPLRTWEFRENWYSESHFYLRVWKMKVNSMCTHHEGRLSGSTAALILNLSTRWQTLQY